jgi:hypothetical protein
VHDVNEFALFDEFHDFSPYIVGLAHHKKQGLHAADTGNNNCPVTKNSAEYSLLAAKAFNTVCRDLCGFNFKNTRFYHQAFVRNAVLGTQKLKEAAQENYQYNHEGCKEGIEKSLFDYFGFRIVKKLARF